jgi:hypothetical protein
MDEAVVIPQDKQTRAHIIRIVADYLRQYPQDLIDAKRLLRQFRASAPEVYQALQLLDRQPASLSALSE